MDASTFSISLFSAFGLRETVKMRPVSVPQAEGPKKVKVFLSRLSMIAVSTRPHKSELPVLKLQEDAGISLVSIQEVQGGSSPGSRWIVSAGCVESTGIVVGGGCVFPPS